MERYKFPPMLGPSSRHSEGSRQWAECLGNEIEYKVDRAAERGVDELIPLIKKVLSAATPPWEVWPEPPCKSIDAFFQLCTGRTYDQIWCMIKYYKEDNDLSRSLDVSRANEQATTVQAGGDKKSNRIIHNDIMNDRKVIQGTGRVYLLRRIAREAPAVLAAYEQGEYKSVRAAADAAGIPRLTQTSKLRSAWKKATVEQRAEFIKMIQGENDGRV